MNERAQKWQGHVGGQAIPGGGTRAWTSWRQWAEWPSHRRSSESMRSSSSTLVQRNLGARGLTLVSPPAGPGASLQPFTLSPMRISSFLLPVLLTAVTGPLSALPPEPPPDYRYKVE